MNRTPQDAAKIGAFIGLVVGIATTIINGHALGFALFQIAVAITIGAFSAYWIQKLRNTILP